MILNSTSSHLVRHGHESADSCLPTATKLMVLLVYSVNVNQLSTKMFGVALIY